MTIKQARLPAPVRRAKWWDLPGIGSLVGLIPAGCGSVVLTGPVARRVVELLPHRDECAHGHRFDDASTRIRLRRRVRHDKGGSAEQISVERDCATCKHIQYVESRRHERHQMKGGRLT